MHEGSLNLKDGFTEDNIPVSFESQIKIDDKAGVTDPSGFTLSVAILKDTIRANSMINPEDPNYNKLDSDT